MADKTEIYHGARITVRFDGNRCIHSRNCVLGDPRVFVPNAPGPWINPDAVPIERVVELVHACPSGALTYERSDGEESEQPPVVNTVRVRENGPLAFHAQLHFRGGEVALRATLCRCGASKTKPFCDGSHTEAGFTATGEPAAKESQPLAVRGGALAITPRLDGPLHVKGSLEVVSGTGHTLNRVSETWLCRCGHSSNKPYCDGTHKKVGFKAEGEAPVRKPESK
ncbi:MAG TPA: CDGSH iron-sulfur domain-containing protein [Steroidobacteraceae bacterium]|nr:CDGSH iron-sulfur domain-containing protein [Steroidobacteraceae bacterium]